MQANKSIVRRQHDSRVGHCRHNRGSRVSRTVKDSNPAASNSTAISGTRAVAAAAVATGEGGSAPEAVVKVAKVAKVDRVRVDKSSIISSQDRRRSSFPTRQRKGGSIRSATADLSGDTSTAT